MVVSGRDAARLDAATRELEATGAAVFAVVADVTRREDADRLVEAARERFGRLDVLVNNAGITRDQFIVRMKDDDWDQVLDTNLRGVFLMTRAAASDDAPAERADHQHLLDGGGDGQSRPSELLGGQGRG